MSARKKRGRLTSIENIKILLELEDERLYCPHEVAATVVDREVDPVKYERLRKGFWNWGNGRGELSSFPDNAVMTKSGMPKKILKNVGKKNEKWEVELLSGEEYPSWRGAKWKSLLTTEERDVYTVYCRGKGLTANTIFKKIIEKFRPRLVRYLLFGLIMVALSTMFWSSLPVSEKQFAHYLSECEVQRRYVVVKKERLARSELVPPHRFYLRGRAPVELVINTHPPLFIARNTTIYDAD